MFEDLMSELQEERPLKAREAGMILAKLIGFDHPIPPTAMWRYARAGRIPVVRLGGRLWFRPQSLRELVKQGEPQKRREPATHSNQR